VAALGARLLGSQLLGLLRGGLFESAGGQAACCGQGHFFHLRQIDIQSRPVVAKGATDDNFSPGFGELGNGVQILGSEFA
jgi:hypothetical protein